MQEEEFKSRIPKSTGMLMIMTALFFSLFQWIFVFFFMGWLVAIFSYLTFSLWFKIRDVGILERFGGKKIIAWFVSPLFSVLSLGVIPGIMITVLMTISIVRFEDRLIQKRIVSREQLKNIESLVLRNKIIG